MATDLEQIQQMFVTAYNTALLDLPQTKFDPFDLHPGAIAKRPLTTPAVGAPIRINTFGTLTAEQREERLSKIKLGTPDITTRYLYPLSYDLPAFPYTDEDGLAMLVDPQGAWMQNAISAFERTKTNIKLQAFRSTVLGGALPGNTTYSFPASAVGDGGWVIPHDSTADGDKGGTSSGLTFDKMQLARQVLFSAGNPPPYYLVINSAGMRNLQNEEKWQSIETSPVKILSGTQAIQHVRFGDFYIIETPLITSITNGDLDGDTTIYRFYAFAAGAIVYAQYAEPQFQKVELVEYNGRTYALKAWMTAGAIRVNECSVVEIEAKA